MIREFNQQFFDDVIVFDMDRGQKGLTAVSGAWESWMGLWTHSRNFTLDLSARKPETNGLCGQMNGCGHVEPIGRRAVDPVDDGCILPGSG